MYKKQAEESIKYMALLRDLCQSLLMVFSEKLMTECHQSYTYIIVKFHQFCQEIFFLCH